MDYRERLNYRGSEPFLCFAAADAKEGVMARRSGVFVRKCYTVECNVRGRGSVIVNGKEHKINPGDCYVLFPSDRIEYISDPTRPRCGVWCYLGGEKVGEAMADAAITSDSPFAPPSAFSDVERIINRMRELSTQRDIGSEYMRTALVYELLSVLTRGRVSQNGEMWLKRAVAIMEASYNTDITVSGIAAKVGFERSYFSTVFKSQTGITPHSYLTSVRIGRARELLSQGVLTVAECAEAVGLDSRNFARLFRAETGMSPKEFKQLSKSRKEKDIL